MSFFMMHHVCRG